MFYDFSCILMVNRSGGYGSHVSVTSPEILNLVQHKELKPANTNTLNTKYEDASVSLGELLCLEVFVGAAVKYEVKDELTNCPESPGNCLWIINKIFPVSYQRDTVGLLS